MHAAHEVEKEELLRSYPSEAQLQFPSHNKQIQEKALQLMGEQRLWTQNILALPKGAVLNRKVSRVLGDEPGSPPSSFLYARPMYAEQPVQCGSIGRTVGVRSFLAHHMI